MLNKPDLKVAYFGDQLQSDVYATYEFSQRLQSKNSPARWDAFAIIEEMSFADKSLEKGVDAQLPSHNQDLWGSSYFIDEK